MLLITGSRAFSDFTKSKLLKNLQSSIPQLNDIHARYWHFVNVKEGAKPSDVDHSKLESVLTYGEHSSSDDLSDEPKGELFLVTPRMGTISPWSSKATDILHNCGLDFVERVERGIAYFVDADKPLSDEQRQAIQSGIHDRMMEIVLSDSKDAVALFSEASPKPLRTIELDSEPHEALNKANIELGLALSDDEIDYLVTNYQALGRQPTDVELMMFAQANSEHCRHKIFNADWVIDGKKQDKSLFQMIKNTHKCSPENVLSAYKDNSSVVVGTDATRFMPKPSNQTYQYVNEPVHMLMKVETHNHPTAIAPFPGAATGSGGEIRDEGATGNGSKPKAGLCGFSVSNLKIPNFLQAWEVDFGKPSRIDSALDIMLEGPIGAAAFNNEFGRPNITGYFRTYEAEVPAPSATGEGHATEIRGYHKPIMLAGGLGNIREGNVEKQAVPHGTPIVVLGGPAMLIGLGGGAASSMASGSSAEDLDFASVQRGNPEMERRCQEVIDRCVAMGDETPVLSMHDVGAGGISNAIPEVIDDAGMGGVIELRQVPNDEQGMAPMEIWCNEAQERYVLAIDKSRLEVFENLCKRERAVYAVVGEATTERHLKLTDSLFENNPVDIPMELLLGKPPKMTRDVEHREFTQPSLDLSKVILADAIQRVLQLPTVASKSFLITIGDRSVTGMINRDQMVGPWQVPVADAAVTCTDYQAYAGESMAVGERTPLALVNPEASGRMAIGEAITNIATASIPKISDVFLSANWMAAAGYGGEDAALFDTVKVVGEELCPELGIAIPVGKDSLSMKTVWQQEQDNKSIDRTMAAPLSLVISAFAVVDDVRNTSTPQLRTDKGDTSLLLVDLGAGKNRLAASALSQVYNQLGDVTPDLDDSAYLKDFFAVIQSLRKENKVIAYHDRSDGGLLAAVTEMAFAGHCGLDIALDQLVENIADTDSVLQALFNEELGAVIQVSNSDLIDIMNAFDATSLKGHVHPLATINEENAFKGKSTTFEISHNGVMLYQKPLTELHGLWSETSYKMQSLRDNSECAQSEFDLISDESHTGLFADLSFDVKENPVKDLIANTAVRPKVAILREQGVNGQIEMAVAFDRAGFESVDVHMTDIISGRVTLADFKGLVACGGFSYGDVLGAGGGWAKTILNNELAKSEFSAFFAREDSFGLGVCNGCQMFSHLKDMIDGAEHWPSFYRNASEQFEARFAQVEIGQSSSILLQGMEGSKMPIAVAHGEGRAVFSDGDLAEVKSNQQVSMQYIDSQGQATERYPLNPNGSVDGATGFTSKDGRFTIMMPHPERVIRTVTNSWHPDDWDEDSPWMRMFYNARKWVG